MNDKLSNGVRYQVSLWLLCSPKSSSNRNGSPSAAYHGAKGQLTLLAIASMWTTVSLGELKEWRAVGVIPRQEVPVPACWCDSSQVGVGYPADGVSANHVSLLPSVFHVGGKPFVLPLP